VTSRALADRLAAALRDAGVNVVEPVGERFDPARHEAGGATPTKDPTQTGTIAAVEVPGYVDRSGRVLRAPVVTVYQAGQGAAPAQSPAARAVNQPSGAYPTVNPPSGAYPTVPQTGPPTVPQTGPRRTEEDR
jgi:GrpE